MSREYRTHDGWSKACQKLLTRVYEELGTTKDEVLYWRLSGETKKDLREFHISAKPLTVDGGYEFSMDYLAIGEWDGEKGEIYKEANKSIATVLRDVKLARIKGKIPKDEGARPVIGNQWCYQMFLRSHGMNVALTGPFLEAARWMMSLDTGYDLRYIHKDLFSVGHHECNHDDKIGWKEVGQIWK